ncbi:hypothetical protein chiPu_0018104, partial [Chiloscyllium punctatum]|nr:hypothetical protein [Chiloscyllium punctatum]
GDVTLTDQPNVLSQIQFNVANNIPVSVQQRTKVSALIWGENQNQFPTNYDFILGTDIVYSSRDFPALIKTLKHLSNENTVIYICSKMRESMGAMDFHEKLLPMDFNTEIVHRTADKEIVVFKGTKKSPGDVEKPQM